METQLDRIENGVNKLVALATAKQNAPSPFKPKAPTAPPPKPVPANFEKVFGPRPAPAEATDGEIYRDFIQATKAILEQPPSEYVAGVLTFTARTKTDYPPVFVLEEDGDLWACIKPGLRPWFVEPSNFVGSNVEGLILAFTGGLKPGDPNWPA